MIKGIFHIGSGLGNMLHRYVAARCLALEKGEDFGMVAPDLFKGKEFLNLDMGVEDYDYIIEQPAGKVIPRNSEGVIDGEFQSESVWENHIDKVREWLAVEPLHMPDNVCVINFRGGEYVGVPELFLPQAYWDLAIKEMIECNPEMRFEVHTDDPETAKRFFPHFDIYTGIGLNWRAIRYAKNLILSNSSFAILPAYLNEDTNVIAPKYWARYNTKEWINPDNNYKKFTYIHHED